MYHSGLLFSPRRFIYNDVMEIMAGIIATLACLVIIMAVIRMLESEIRKGKSVDLGTWIVFGGIILFAAIGILGGVYLMFFH